MGEAIFRMNSIRDGECPKNGILIERDYNETTSVFIMSRFKKGVVTDEIVFETDEFCSDNDLYSCVKDAYSQINRKPNEKVFIETSAEDCMKLVVNCYNELNGLPDKYKCINDFECEDNEF